MPVLRHPLHGRTPDPESVTPRPVYEEAPVPDGGDVGDVLLQAPSLRAVVRALPPAEGVQVDEGPTTVVHL